MRVSETEPDWVHMKRLHPYKKFNIFNTVSYTIEIVLLVISTDYRISMSALAS